ncbi:MAG: hypothetical protein Q8N42_00365 [bacterium]|nr:hypothetical protein [bacterium]
MTWLKKKKKLVVILALILVAFFTVSYFLISSVPVREPKVFGATFSEPFAKELGLDWKKAYEAIFSDLGVKNARIPVYWSEVESKKGEWHFEDIDWQLSKAKEYNAKVILAVGRKLPRWPECFEPEWAKNLSEEKKQELILKMIENVVMRYDSFPVVSTWQVENEPFLPFGECPKLDKQFLDEEIALVKKISDKPVIISDSGEFGTWFPAAKRADIFGSTLYRYVWNRVFGYITYPLPPSFFRLKQGLLKLFVGQKPIIVVELQAEPWTPRALRDIPFEEQFIHFNPERFEEILEYIKGTGFDIFYFWGVEWWYWLKTQGYPEIWDIAKEAIKNIK